MNRKVVVRYGEIALKSEPVRREFRNILVKNIKSVLNDIPHSIETERGRIFIKTPRPGDVSLIVAKIPGIVSSSPTWKTNVTMREIKKLAVKVSKEFSTPEQTFAVRARRTGKHKFSSKDVEEEVGERILENNPQMTVDLDSPENQLHIEIRGEDAYIFTEVVGGPGGLPVGTQGEVLSIFSGTTESIASTYLMLKRGTLVHLLFLDPGKKEIRNQVFSLAEEFSAIQPNLKLHALPFRPLSEKISENAPRKLRWILCKRLSLKLAEAASRKIGAKAIISNESIDQISSYSLQNSQLIIEKTKLPVMNPLLGFETNELEELREKITEKKMEGEYICSQTPPNPGEVNLDKIRNAEMEIPEKSLIEFSMDSSEVHKLGS